MSIELVDFILRLLVSGRYRLSRLGEGSDTIAFIRRTQIEDSIHCLLTNEAN